jgi:class 3 adenylate cyclase/tetratricopeptide (TPR) repeat protein
MLKVVTILFVDVVGSTARAEKMHPEDTRVLMTDFFKAMSEEIRREDGTVEGIAGDGLMAVFGIPFAHEDDPFRAVRAARYMLKRLADWNADKEDVCQIEIRIGINTGEVSAAGRPGEGLLVTGDPVNVAARLEQVATPGTVVIGERTARSVRGSFGLRPLEPPQLKGKSEPMQAFMVMDETSEDGMSEGRWVAPLIGRDEDLTALNEVYMRCQRTRSPHLITLLGEAGVGKSRLTEEFLRALPDTTRILTCHCISHGEGADLWPLRQILAAAAGFGDSDPPQGVVSAIEELVADRVGPQNKSRQIVDALATTLGIAPDPSQTLDPRLRHREFLLAWRALLSGMASSGPVVIVVQDIHWAGERLLDILTDLACRTEGPILFLCPTRPGLLESRPDWGTGTANHTSLRLEALSKEQSGELIAGLVNLEGLPDTVRSLVLERCEGNPFFLQEIVRHLIESGQVETEGRRYHSADPRSASVEIPDNVHGVLLARIDLMGEDKKRVGQQAAVVGRTFWEGAVAKLCNDSEITDLLTALERQAFIRESHASSLTNEIEYSFTHILIRDALYETMPRRLRGASHEIVAQWIEESSGERSEEHLETLARHYQRAHELLGRDDLRAKARDLLLRASTAALQQFGVKHGLDLARTAVSLSKGPEERTEALETLGDGAMLGYLIDDAWAAYSEALEDAAKDPGLSSAVARLAAKAAIAATRFEGAMTTAPSAADIKGTIEVGLSVVASEGSDDRSRCLLLASKAFAHSLDEDLRQDHDVAGEALTLAEELKDPGLVSVALDSAAFALDLDGRYAQIYALQKRRVELIPHLQDLSEICDIYGSAAWSAYFVGRHLDTITYTTKCMDRANGIDPGNYQHALQWRVIANFRAGNWDAALRDQSELESLVMGDGDVIPVFAASAFATAFLCRQLRGDVEAASRYLELLRRLRRDQEATGDRISMPRVNTALGLIHRGELEEALDWLDYEAPFARGPLLETRCEVVRAAGDSAAAVALISRIDEVASSMGAPTIDCYVDRLRGQVALWEGDANEAEISFIRSAEGFSRIAMPWEEAMSRLSLSELRLEKPSAVAEADLLHARSVFERLRSVREIHRVDECLRRLTLTS